ncbi:MAG: UpxY family transcription antiterminator [Prevotellaceae bacterium]|jgi:transcription antitermination factor NusG|nr:UpxY family transcription antiterminator [Prevotellaceae bacterium]
MQQIHKEQAQWRVLYTKPRAEKKALESLSKKGYCVYLPCVTVVRQWSDRKKKIQEPLFRSYLFIHCKENQISEAATDTSIAGVVRFNGGAAVVRDREMDTIRRVEAGKDPVAVVTQTLIAGQKVLIKTGALKGLTGILTQIRGSQRVAIEIESLGCNLLVEVPAANIEKQ